MSDAELLEQVKVLPASTSVEAAMTVFDHGTAAQERQLLALGVPVDFLAKVMMQHAASVIALVKSPALRTEIIKKLIGNFPAQVHVAVMAASTTKGGIVVPEGANAGEPTGNVP